MIQTLYAPFQHWTEKGSLFLYSDTHFNDNDCKLMDPNWPAPAEQIKIINRKVHPNDTLILLGDIGNPNWVSEIQAKYKILIKGNHDVGSSKYLPYFNEIYSGPLLISEKILLSHEPIYGINWCVNIHGHTHDSKGFKEDNYHYCVCSNTINYTPLSLGELIKGGLISSIDNIHRLTINKREAYDVP